MLNEPVLSKVEGVKHLALICCHVELKAKHLAIISCHVEPKAKHLAIIYCHVEPKAKHLAIIYCHVEPKAKHLACRRNLIPRPDSSSRPVVTQNDIPRMFLSGAAKEH